MFLRLILSTLFIATLAGTVQAETLEHNIVMKAGQSWWLLADRIDDATGKNIDTSHEIYMAVFMAAPPKQPVVYARFVVENSAVKPGKVLVQASKEQTKALAGLKGVWVLTYLPTLGDAQYNLIKGTMEVKP